MNQYHYILLFVIDLLPRILYFSFGARRPRSARLKDRGAAVGVPQGASLHRMLNRVIGAPMTSAENPGNLGTSEELLDIPGAPGNPRSLWKSEDMYAEERMSLMCTDEKNPRGETIIPESPEIAGNSGERRKSEEAREFPGTERLSDNGKFSGNSQETRGTRSFPGIGGNFGNPKTFRRS